MTFSKDRVFWFSVFQHSVKFWLNQVLLILSDEVWAVDDEFFKYIKLGASLMKYQDLIGSSASVNTSFYVGGLVGQLFEQLKLEEAGVGAVIRMLELQGKGYQEKYGKLLGSVIEADKVIVFLKRFEAVNKKWVVPGEVLDVVGVFKEVQEKVGRVSLPTIDWRSAAVLAMVLGGQGVNQQLALLGVGVDEVVQSTEEVPEKDTLLSRMRGDVWTLVSVLLTLLIFIYQEYSDFQKAVERSKFEKQIVTALHDQYRAVKDLTALIELALVKSATQREELFVVRERPATVRGAPMHGSPIQGKLLPNEIGRAIDRKGRWVKIEYYHWLHQEYRTGWVLKHYLDRVPENYSRNGQRY